MKKSFGYYIAFILSTIFHPIFVFPIYLIIVIGLNPYVLGANKDPVLLLNIMFFAVFFPALAVLIMKLSGMISHTNLKKQTDRIGPFIVSIVFYIWLFLNLKNQSVVGAELKIFSLGLCISLCLAFFINVFSKISIHTMAWGSLFGATAILWQHFGYQTVIVQWRNTEYAFAVVIVLITLLTIGGAVASSRLTLKAHLLHQVYGGFIIGILSQILALRLF